MVLHECETWSLVSRKEHWMKIFENMVQRGTCASKKNEMVVGWRKLHNELYDLYYSPNIIAMKKPRKMKWAGHVSRMGIR
jgi:hypothetical protein